MASSLFTMMGRMGASADRIGGSAGTGVRMVGSLAAVRTGMKLSMFAAGRFFNCLPKTVARRRVPILAVVAACVLAPMANAQCVTGWTLITPTEALPTARERFGMVYDSVLHRVVVFGGSQNSGPSGETWEWDGANWTLRATTGPSARSECAMVFDSNRGVAVLYGGSGPGALSDTWEWNGTAGIWTSIAATGPGARSNAAMAYDAARAKVVLFGSNNAPTSNSETWVYDGTTHAWTLGATNGSAFIGQTTMAYDSNRQRVVLFGGSNLGGTRTNQTWEWNGAEWTLMSSTGPLARNNAKLAYDADRALLILFGGNAGSAPLDGLSDTWAWNGVTWVQQLLTPPTGRDGHGLAFDTFRHAIVCFGGNASGGNTRVNDVHEVRLTFAPTIFSQPFAANACAGEPAAFSVAALGTASFTYQWRKGTVPIDTVATPSAATATLSLANVQPSDADSYDCIVSNACGSVTSSAATLTVDSAPTISQQPSSTNACTTGSATFAVGAAGTAPFTYEWQIQTAPATWAALDAIPLSLPCGGSAVATTPAASQTGIAISPCPGVTAYQVRCIVSNGCGSITSNEATYSVCYANCDCSATPPQLTANDFQCFLNSFASGDPYANCDGSTANPMLTANDFQCFLNSFANGCP